MVQSLNTNVCEEHIFSNIFNTLSKDVHNFFTL